jgi:hypothetical protein
LKHPVGAGLLPHPGAGPDDRRLRWCDYRWGVTSETAATATAPGDVVRYRCAACGNLTRFNVVTTRRTSAFHHFSVGGDLSVEEEEVLDETVEEVTCRWCGNGKGVEILESSDADADPT